MDIFISIIGIAAFVAVIAFIVRSFSKNENQIKQPDKQEDQDKVYDFYGIKDNQKFYLDDSKIVIYFDLYEIAPYAAGIPEFPIIVENIKPQIKEDYIELII